MVPLSLAGTKEFVEKLVCYIQHYNFYHVRWLTGRTNTTDDIDPYVSYNEKKYML